MPDSCPLPDGESENAESLLDIYDWGDNIDPTTFEQILEMDDDTEEREFSRSIVVGFFEQAETTFTQMDEALESKDLSSLASLGHFLKGSSATLGLTKVKNSCEKIQHFGQKKDQDGAAVMEDEEKCLERIESTLNIVKKEYYEAVKMLRAFFGMSIPSESTTEDPDKGSTATSTISEATDPSACTTGISTDSTATDLENPTTPDIISEKCENITNGDKTKDTAPKITEEAVITKSYEANNVVSDENSQNTRIKADAMAEVGTDATKNPSGIAITVKVAAAKLTKVN